MTVFTIPPESLPAKIDGYEVILIPKRFKSGSVGWYSGGKIEVNGVRCQLSLSLVVVGSKPPLELIEVKSVEDLAQVVKDSEKPPVKTSKGKAGKTLPKPEKVS